jgi:hypothetical protein
LGFVAAAGKKVTVPVLRTLLRLLAAAALVAVLGVPVHVAAQGRPSCSKVLRELHRGGGRNGGHKPDATKIAKRMNVSEDWVERCATTYGRRVGRSEAPREGIGNDDSGLKTPEELEYEEVSREELETAGDKYFTVIEDDEINRKRLRRFDAAGFDSSMEWDAFETHIWEPNLGHAWQPFLHDDDHPNEYE